MMRRLTIQIYLLLSMLCSIGCSDECTMERFALAVASESDAFIDAVDTYASDPSEAHCFRLKEATLAYRDALEANRGCAESVGLGADLETTLRDTQTVLSGLTC